MDCTDSSSVAAPKQRDGCFFFSIDPEDPAEEEEKALELKIEEEEQ